MIKVVSIDKIEPYVLTCSFNDGSQRSLDIRPLIQKHIHLEGIRDLLEESRFLKAEIGEVGQILWRNSIRSSNDEIWDYDISPEFFYYKGMKV